MNHKTALLPIVLAMLLFISEVTMTTAAQNQAWMDYWNNKGPRPTDNSVFTGYAPATNPIAPSYPLQAPTQANNQAWMNYWNNKGPRPAANTYFSGPGPVQAPAAPAAANPYTGFGSSNYPAPSRFGFTEPPNKLIGTPNGPVSGIRTGISAGLQPVTPPVQPRALSRDQNPSIPTWTRTGISAGLPPAPAQPVQPTAPSWLKTLEGLFSGMTGSTAFGGQGYAAQIPSTQAGAGLQTTAYGISAGLLNTPPPDSLLNALQTIGFPLPGVNAPTTLLGAAQDLASKVPTMLTNFDAENPTPETPTPENPTPEIPSGPAAPIGNMNQIMKSSQFNYWYDYVDTNTGVKNSDTWSTMTDDEKNTLLSQIGAIISGGSLNDLFNYPPNYQTVPELATQPDNAYAGFGYTSYAPYPAYQGSYYGGNGGAPAHWLTNLTNWNIPS